MRTIDVLRQRLGVPDGRVVREGLVATVNFFDTFVHDDPAQWWMYLRGIDFHQPVEIRYLNRGTPLVPFEWLAASEMALKPFSYFRNPTGSRFKGSDLFPPLDDTTFNVACETPALVSYARPVSIRNRDVLSRRAIGARRHTDIGGTQFIIAFADLAKLIRNDVRAMT